MTDERRIELRQYYNGRLVRNYFKHEDHLQIWPWSGWGPPVSQIRCFNGKKKLKIVWVTEKHVLLENCI